MKTKRLIELYFKNYNLLNDLEEKRKEYNDFFQFNKSTGLGGLYKQTKRKLTICERLTT